MAAKVEQLLDPPAARRRASSRISVERVASAEDLEAFLELPHRIYAKDPSWVAPLVMERRDFLDPARNPFFRHANVELFLAREHGRVVGRAAACEDRNYNAFHGSKTCFFGFYEAIDDDDVPLALWDAAEGWARRRGLVEVLGPANFTSNHDLGLLVDGFDAPPALMMTYNPRYYVRHFEEVLALGKAKDLWAWWVSAQADPPEKVVRIAEKLREREGVRVRPVDLSDFANEVRRIRELYNAAWEKNWGFVPMTDEEFDHLAKDLKQLVVPDLCLIAEVNGEPAAISLTVPDLNQALIHVGGRLTRWGLPLGLAKLLYWQKKIDRLRLVILGIKQPYRKRGLDAILYLDTIRNARRLGYAGGEVSWTLEDNVLVNRAIELLGGRRHKTYRVYRKGL